MKSFIWIAVNIIGLFILIFVYSHRDKTSLKKTMNQKLLEYLQLSVMLYLVTDTAGQLLGGMVFPGSHTLIYVFTVLFYVFSVLPGYFYLLYCDNKVFAGTGNTKRRIMLYSIPVAFNTLVALTTPFTHALFYIDEFNVYIRGEFFWLTMALAFCYVLSVIPLLIIKTKNKPSLPPKGVNLYLYLFPIPPVILAIIQLINYELLLVGIGLVISSFIIFLADVQSSDDNRSLSARFHNINVIQFAIIAFVMTTGVLLVLDNVTEEISMDYAQYNSVSTVNLFEAYINKEIGVLGTAANSKAITDWFKDEDDPEKRQAAFEEFIGIMRILYSDNMYITLDNSRHAYAIDTDSLHAGFGAPVLIDENNHTDQWYFTFMRSDYDYNLNVDVDNINNRKAIWLNYKIHNVSGDMIGAIAVGMDLSRIAERVFAQFDNTRFRGFIIDENGIIQLDSALLGEDDVLMFNVVNSIFDEIHNTEFREALQAYLDDFTDPYHELINEAMIINLHSGQFRYATITPIGSTYWSVVKLYDSSSLFDATKLIPLLFILGIVFLLFIYSTNRITKRLIFNPINNLVESLIRKRKNDEEDLYGMERKDEIGLLSNTVQEYYAAGYYDGLTGIHNRRYFEMTLQQIMNTLSRTQSTLSVLMMDVDHFKKYNDTYGHAEGDECLKAIAKALGKTMQRKGDFAARYGGEEFVVVLPETDETGAKKVAEKILAAVRDLKIPHEKNDSGNGIATISIGITTGNSSVSQDSSAYLKRADEALYESKETGRNKYTFLELSGTDEND